jgi:hypothetical protein
MGSRQVPNARSKEFKPMQLPPGQMTFGQKVGPMKQEKVILDYGRKNRLSKLVAGGQGLPGPSQNLARKGTQQMSMSMNQFLNQSGPQQHAKHREGQMLHPNQSKNNGEQMYRASSKSRSPELVAGASQPPLKQAKIGDSLTSGGN